MCLVREGQKLEDNYVTNTYLSVLLHDLDHFLGGRRDAVGKERDEEGNVVHGLQMGPDVLDAPDVSEDEEGEFKIKSNCLKFFDFFAKKSVLNNGINW